MQWQDLLPCEAIVGSLRTCHMAMEMRFKSHSWHPMNVTKISHVIVVIKTNHIDMTKTKYTHIMKVGMVLTTCQ
jgi:hypothetical protein